MNTDVLDPTNPPRLFLFLQLASILVLSFDCFAVYVIKCHTPERMRSYGRYLLIYQLVSALTDASAMLLLTPWFSFPVIGGFPLGPMNAVGIPTEAQTVYGFGVAILLLCSVGQLFFQRQQSILTKGHRLKLVEEWHFVIWHILVYGLPTTSVIFLAIVLLLNDCDTVALAKEYPTLALIARQPNYFCVSDFYSTIILHFVSGVATIAFTIIIVPAISSACALYSFDVQLSKRTRDMQKQMLGALVVQSVVPFSLLLFPVSIGVYVTIYNRSDLLYLNPWYTVLFSVHGPVSTFFILFAYPPYRKYVRQLLTSKTKTVPPTTTSMECIFTEIPPRPIIPVTGPADNRDTLSSRKKDQRMC